MLRSVCLLAALLFIGQVAAQADVSQLLAMVDAPKTGGNDDLLGKLSKVSASQPAAAQATAAKANGQDAVDKLAENVIKDIVPEEPHKKSNKVRLDQVDIMARAIIRGITKNTRTVEPPPKRKPDEVDELAIHVIKGIEPEEPTKKDNKVRLDVVDMIARQVIRGISKEKTEAPPAPKKKNDQVDDLAEHVIKEIKPVIAHKEANKVRLDLVDILARRVIRGDAIRPQDVPGGEAPVADLSTQLSKVAASEPAAAKSA